MLDYALLAEKMHPTKSNYQNADPFAHMVIDDFLSPEVVGVLAPLFPPPEIKPGQGDRSADMADGMPAQFRKRWISRERSVNLAFRRLYWELNSGPFIELLERMSGIDNILPDPHLFGGGIHQTEAGGFLRVHADFNRHPHFDLERRLNLLIYFNEDWGPEWGGDLELWSEDMSSCRQRISPIAGRCVIFSTTSTSFHGHPHALACPEGTTRKSVALYYYTNSSSSSQSRSEHGTLWQKLPGEVF
jgi:Rps23 Pro-64 3,4-dihydroxylase Tpa1-like proline 4-hydroxylase